MGQSRRHELIEGIARGICQAVMRERAIGNMELTFDLTVQRSGKLMQVYFERLRQAGCISVLIVLGDQELTPDDFEYMAQVLPRWAERVWRLSMPTD